MASKIGRWLLFVVLFSGACFANQAYVGYCSNGGTKVVTSGITSTTSVMASYPGCTVTVNNLGGGLATIFSDNLGTPLSNPFQASLITGQFVFFAGNARYSITLSGGTPIAFPLPVTIPDILLNDPASPLGCLSIPALTGDVTSAGGTCATVLPNIAAAGTGLKTTINAKGQVTGVTTAASTDLSDTAIIARLNAAANFGANPVTTGALVSTTGTFSGSISGTGATFTSEVAPSVTGVQLGDTAHRWDLFARNIDWSGTFSGGALTVSSLTVTPGASTLSSVNGIQIVGSGTNTNIAAAVTNAGSTGAVLIPPGYAGTDNAQCNSVPCIDFRQNTQAGVSFYHGVRSTFPAQSSGALIYPAGHDFPVVAWGPADVHLVNGQIDCTSSTSIVGAGTNTITVGACADGSGYGGPSGDTSKLSHASGVTLVLEPGTANEETVTNANWSILSGITLSVTTTLNHTQPYTVRQQGLLFADGRGWEANPPSGTVLYGMGTTTSGFEFYLPNDTGAAFPNSAIQFVARITGANSANKNLLITNNNGAGQIKLQTSASADVIQVGDAGLNLINPGATIIFGSNGGTGTGGTIHLRNNQTDQTEKVTLNLTNGNVTSVGQLISSVATGTAPLSIASTTPVANLTVQNCSTCVLTGTPTGTGIQTATLKKGTGVGNYTSASTTYVVVDATNLCYTVTIPTGWKLVAQASANIGSLTAVVNVAAALTDNAACATANAGILTEASVFGPSIGNGSQFSLSWVINGDGAAHNVALQFKTTNGADSVTLGNASATFIPTMTFLLTPSN